MLAGEEVLDGLALEETAPGLLDGELRQVAVRGQRGSAAFFTMWSTCSWSKVSNRSSAARPPSASL
ncbi:hypothetical protein ACFWVF_07910 [Streptomyces sp. NPDC058659]|uniref:hypothetical protein n=1 Tax=unclassified Streptomyces TaxID=2593676 RepID=UPI003667E063